MLWKIILQTLLRELMLCKAVYFFWNVDISISHTFCHIKIATVLHPAKHHLWIIKEIVIDNDTIFCITGIYPIRYLIISKQSVTFLKNDNITCGLCSCISFKCCIWKTYSPYQISSLCQVFSKFRIFLIKSSLTCNKCYDPARFYHIKCLCKEIIMN